MYLVSVFRLRLSNPRVVKFLVELLISTAEPVVISRSDATQLLATGKALPAIHRSCG